MSAGQMRVVGEKQFNARRWCRHPATATHPPENARDHPHAPIRANPAATRAVCSYQCLQTATHAKLAAPAISLYNIVPTAFTDRRYKISLLASPYGHNIGVHPCPCVAKRFSTCFVQRWICRRRNWLVTAAATFVEPVTVTLTYWPGGTPLVGDSETPVPAIFVTQPVDAV